MRAARIVLALALAALVVVLWFPNLVPGVPPAGVAAWARILLALLAALASGAAGAQLERERPLVAGATTVLPAALVGGALGVMIAMRPEDLLLVAVLTFLFLVSGTVGGALVRWRRG